MILCLRGHIHIRNSFQDNKQNSITKINLQFQVRHNHLLYK